ncbi:hypothetical protein ASPZODRAFT_131704 [Penicilliopsis zonata CBS 506.65]|uniref:NmrA-like domain-containing protein n=1 Tax=Penicilliopsis zonata CBS 506.65 TaxID=1073090 RepID=A0A1L9SI11_9EURO|nr:hypothetical protein ASPZODRAFT_131704 [Penicilliopsis zonata CBS 506.65]OJJ46818.1 hypothetical protein ASPZODRAFT_131704 [Penicilliopsis zonata CBS 506.65]
MSKLLVVFGATGNQGGSVVSFVLNDPELSSQYRLRAVTRDPSGPAAQALTKQGVEVVQADFDDQASIQAALRDAHTVFLVTVSIYGPDGKEKQSQQGRFVADTAVAQGAQYLIFSTAPSVTKTSGDKYRNVDIFDVKAELEEYIRGLPVRSAFFSVGSFMQNYHTGLRPRPVGDGTYSISSPVSPQTRTALIDISGDSGKFVGAILADPERFAGSSLFAATATYTFEEIAGALSAATGKTVKYTQLPEGLYRSFFPKEAAATRYVEMFAYIQDFGYFGPQTEELVRSSAASARGKVTTFEEFLRREPLVLE